MPDYTKSKIYKIVCDTTKLIYVGATTTTLNKRFYKHLYDYKKYLEGNKVFITSFKCIENNNCHIELLEKCSCSSKKELDDYESYWIRKLDCVNKVIPNRTPQEYYRDNKDSILARQKRYDDKHIVKKRINNLQNYYDNRERILKYKAFKFECECGSILRRDSFNSHLKSNKHKKQLNDYLDGKWLFEIEYSNS